MEKKSNPSISENEDFIFRFDILSTEGKALYDDPIVEMFRKQIANLLDTVVLMAGESEIKIDGFKFLNNSDVVYKLFSKPD